MRQVNDVIYRHWLEVAHDKDSVPLDVNWNELLREESAGRFKVMVARRNGKMIGYITFRIFTPDRYRSTRYCNADVFWMSPKERGRAVMMFRAALNGLPKPYKTQWRRKIGISDDNVDRIMTLLGLKATEIVYTGYVE